MTSNIDVRLCNFFRVFGNLPCDYANFPVFLAIYHAIMLIFPVFVNLPCDYANFSGFFGNLPCDYANFSGFLAIYRAIMLIFPVYWQFTVRLC